MTRFEIKRHKVTARRIMRWRRTSKRRSLWRTRQFWPMCYGSGFESGKVGNNMDDPRMPIMTFRKSYAPLRGVDIIEVWWGDRFIATITPGPSSIASFTVVSKYLDLDRLVLDPKEPPALAVSFDLDRDA